MSYRVIQWATGGMGRNCLRAVIDHPAMELAGVYVYSDGKAGRDAGDLARRAETGVIATNDIDAILDIDADVVIHAGRIVPPYGSHDDDLIRILSSGKNVISINGYSHPAHWGGERLAALETAGRQGNATLTAAGLNPGFAGEQLAVVASGVCTAIDNLEVVESVSAVAVRHPDYVFKALGFGADPDEVDPNDPAWGPAASLNGMYEEVLAAIAEHLDMKLEGVITEHQVFPATEDLEVAAGLIPAGTISHFRWRWHGIVGGQRRLTMTIHWYMQTAHLDETEPPLWTIRIQGQPGITMQVEVEKRAGDTTPTSAEQIAVAGSVINTIPVVCAAPAGVMLRPLATPYSGRLHAG
ncbi:NAD(P)H-dependent amine dehydrogenase family protein [Elongatibacter sediminis]|uniref:Dihydrodipicolinate reductase N-terminal domain-containing protein n=1 Tax=Elongatibacter sediminis TaxID=3119006 RepID=A0AAW9R9R9_9GAMM